MATDPTPLSLAHHFAELDDPRSERTRRHELLDIIGIALCAVISGAESWPAVERYGHAKRDWLARHFRLAGGIPSHDTFRRVFCLLDPGAFQRGFADWVAALADAGVGARRPIPIDGKTARRSGRRGAGLAPLHLVSAWAGANHVTLGQVAVEDKSNEITAIPKLLEVLDLSGALVTIDAMGCQKEIAAKIVDGRRGLHPGRQGEPPPPVRGHRRLLHRGVGDRLRGPGVERAPGGDGDQSWPAGDAGMPCDRPPRGAARCGPVEGADGDLHGADGRVAEGVESIECRYYIGSFVGTAREYLDAIRGHWGIENPRSDDPRSDNLCVAGRAAYHRRGGPARAGLVA